MEWPDNGEDNGKNRHVSFRTDDDTVAFLDELNEAWGLDSRSNVIRVIIDSYMGLLYGNVFGIIDPDKLRGEAPFFGEMLDHVLKSDTPLPETLQELRLIDIIADPDQLLGAAAVELEEGLDDGS